MAELVIGNSSRFKERHGIASFKIKALEYIATLDEKAKPCPQLSRFLLHSLKTIYRAISLDYSPTRNRINHSVHTKIEVNFYRITILTQDKIEIVYWCVCGGMKELQVSLM